VAVSDKTLIFCHVPKTAGTTLNRIIESQYNPLRIHSIPGAKRIVGIERFKRLPERRRRRIQVLKGHIEYGLHAYLPQPSTYMTMLREPVAQVISSYYYGLSSKAHPLYEIMNARDTTLEDYVDLAQWANNLQTKLLGGIPMAKVQPFESLAIAKRGEIVPPEKFLGAHADDSTLAAAKRNLEREFSVVGVTDRFDESVALMIVNYRWDVPFYQKFRETKKRPPEKIDDAVIEKIRTLNVFDIELHAYGKKLFESALERNRAAVDAILTRWREAPKPGAFTARLRAGMAWARFAASLARSAL
jgi:sulfotransferase famil protein